MEVKNQNIEVKVAEGQTVLEIRHGQALELREPIGYEYDTQINGPSTFIKQRGDLIDKTKAVITVDKEARTIVLETDPGNHYGHTINGRIIIDPRIEEFGINKATRYTRDSLVNFLRMNRFYFPDKEAHARLVAAVRTFEANVNTDVKVESDLRGNKNASVNKKVTTDVPFEFTMALPVIKGGVMKTFTVEVCLDVTDGGIKFWFESPEVKEIIEDVVTIAFDEETKLFGGFAVLLV